MRSFLQKKAGATYFSNSNFTANIRKHNLEFIFSLDGGWHAVVSVVPTPDGVIMLACLGTIADELDRLVSTLRLKPGEHLKFTDVLECKGDFRVIKVAVDKNGLESGIGKEIHGGVNQPLEVIGNSELQKEAARLCNTMLGIYSDLSKSPYPQLKALTEYFYD